MQAKGISIVPTVWGQTLRNKSEIIALFDEIGTEQIIIKPTISAGADSTYLLSLGDDLSEVLQDFQERAFMAQRFIREVKNNGELSIFYINGKYSHCILKRPKAGDFRVQEEHGGLILRYDPEPELMKVSEKILGCITETLLYARVNLVKNSKN